ncbi:MAG: TolC family protein [Flavobacteriales bacterium]|jgi:cobalt-zinc-cadmium efflux system outer membrane protein|nr:TolC family protein [Flavobacteriales bacterium]
MKSSWAFCACLCFISPAYADAQKSLRLNDAIQLALDASPSIKGADAEYGAAQGERRQASAYLNPTIGFDAENVSGTGAFSGTDGAELTAGVSQTFEIGGKRSARIKAADHGQVIARYGQSAAKLNLVRDVSTAFANAVAAQEEASIATEQADLARDVYKTVDKRVSAAAEPLVQRNKAKILMANADLTAQRAQGQKNAVLKVLGALWGSNTAVAVDPADFYKIEKPNIDVDAQKLLRDTVDYKQTSAAADQAQSLLDLERANAVPNPTFNVGLRDFRASNDQALVAGVSIPLPVFNMNRGNIEKARQQAIKANTDRQKLLLDGQMDLAERLQLLQNAYLTASSIKETILPEAQEAFAQAKRGYNAGKFAYLEVLDAQRTLMDTRLSYIQALRDYHIQRAEIERLTAQDIVTGDKP